MGLTFAEAKKQMADGGNAVEQFGLLPSMFEKLRSNKYVVEGIDLTMSPAELFTTDWKLVQVYAFRLVGVEPFRFHTTFTSFLGGEVDLMDYSILFRRTFDFLISWEPDPHAPVEQHLKSPIEGVFILYDRDPDDEDSPVELLVGYPPTLTEFAFRWALKVSLDTALDKGFSESAG